MNDVRVGSFSTDLPSLSATSIPVRSLMWAVIMAEAAALALTSGYLLSLEDITVIFQMEGCAVPWCHMAEEGARWDSREVLASTCKHLMELPFRGGQERRFRSLGAARSQTRAFFRFGKVYRPRIYRTYSTPSNNCFQIRAALQVQVGRQRRLTHRL
jgi:hypothetical protein